MDLLDSLGLAFLGPAVGNAASGEAQRVDGKIDRPQSSSRGPTPACLTLRADNIVPVRRAWQI